MTQSGLAGGSESYDEFSLLRENAAEAGVPTGPLPPVQRTDAMTGMGRVSALRWGDGPPRVVLLHGAGQNAHTWDTVLIAVGVPALAVDLPGHGHSMWRGDRDYSPATNAKAIDEALAAWRVEPIPVVGMSLGGLTTLALAGRHPEAVTELVVVDVTPSVLLRTQRMTAKQRGTTTLTAGPAEFHNLDDMVRAAATAAPQRPEDSVRRGVLHNSRRLPDGRWVWRYDRFSAAPNAFEPLWDEVSRIDVPVGLIRGGDSNFVSDEDVAKFAALCPQLTVDIVPGAGHSVHSDRPREFADLLRRLLRLRSTVSRPSPLP
jgi:pimeloyl-ACP methyl ester carboxylesterase